MGLFSRRHGGDDIAVIMDITGTCEHCHRHTSARLVAYFSGEVLMRCNSCRTANEFTPDDASYNDPKKFAPFKDDRDDPDYKDPGSGGRHTRGMR